MEQLPSPTERVIMVCGHAKLKQSSASSQSSAVMVVVLRVELQHGVVLSCDSSLLLAQSKRFPEQMVEGYSLVDDIELIEQRLEAHYYGLATTAFIAALQDARRQFLQVQQRWLAQVAGRKGDA
ncbi:MAG: DUF3870 domain-containing protein [Alicyclobacillus sp.]|nr:DUF3870 domain-containing protein [Alicyclobacillus sp.]